jgi:hypothetical protein
VNTSVARLDNLRNNLCRNRDPEEDTRFLLAVLLCVMALLISGCVTAQQIDLDKAANNRLRKIALMPVDPPQNVIVQNIGSPAMAFGAIGGLIAGTNDAGHSNTYAEMLKTRKVELASVMTAAIQDELRKSGFEVVTITDQKPKVSENGKTLDYKGIHTDADALMVVRIATVGFMSPQFSSSYRPWVAVTAVVFDAKTEKPIYVKTFSAGYEMKVKNAIHVDTSARFKYGNFDDLSARFDDSVAGLTEGESLIAGLIGRDLKLQ